jgi:O-antigen/teichoic acid export membrane protein
MINKLINGIRVRLADPFWKNVATLFSGSALAQALPILVFPLLTRIYTKEALGFYFIYAAIGLITQIVASLQYHLAIVIPKSKHEANTLTELSLWMVLFVSLVIFILIHLFFGFISTHIEQVAFIKLLYAIPLSTFFLGIFRVASYYLNREKKYKEISVGKITKSITFSVFQLGFGFLGYLSSGLIVGLIIGQSMSAFYLLWKLFRDPEFKLAFNWKEMRMLAKRYKDMPFFNTAISLIVTVSNQLPIFFLSRYFNVGFSGDFGLANRVVSTPMEVVGSSVGQVFFQEAADVVNQKGNLYQLVKITYLRLFKIAVLPFALLLLLAPGMFSLFFGDTYLVSGQMTQLLVPWLFLNFLNSPVSYLFDVLNKQRFMTAFQTIYLLARVGGLFLGYYMTNNVLITVGIFSAVGVVFNVFTIYYYLRISKTTNYQVYQ